MGYSGIILVDKPQDWTSHDVVAKLRGILKERRIGHSGTLDPMATGLLTVFVGRATRAVQFAENDRKRYIAGMRTGFATDTQDITGTVISETGIFPTEAELLNVLPSFEGDIMQLPPMYSAVKIGGKKLYELARRGESVEREPRGINISRIELLGREGDDFILDVSCSKGTYIRTLCNDIGENLGCLACLSSLRRIEAGAFSVADAHSIDEIAQSPQDYILPVDTLFSELPRLYISVKAAEKLKCGGTLKCSGSDGKYRVYAENGEFLAISQLFCGELKTIKSFFEV